MQGPGTFGRRNFSWGLGSFAVLALPAGGLAPALVRARPGALPTGWGPRSLWVTRPQAQESVRAVYWAEGRVQAQGYAALNRLYRDIDRNIEHPMALGLLDLNFAMQQCLFKARAPRPMVLLSGFRTRVTNARVGGVEPNIHGLGLADDYIYEGLGLPDNIHLARLFQVGGLGIYPERGALHKDVGRLRSWVTHGRAGAPAARDRP